jgi:ABC-type glutathione transport system ATPase component
VVVLAGPNGSGKSRYLSVVKRTIETDVPRRRGVVAEIQRADEKISQKHGGQHLAHEQRIEDRSAELSSLGDATLDAQSYAPIQVAGDAFVGEPVQNPGALHRADFHRLHQQPATVAEAYKNQWLIATGVAETLFESDHPDVDPSVAGPRRAYARALNALLETTLQRTIDWDRASHGARNPTFGGRVLKPAELSPGERILFAWCALLARARVAGQATVLMLDEPELHLHPAVCVDILERVIAVLKEDGGQLWLATHSPAIVARFYDQSLYWVAGGRISHASRLDQVLDALLGGPDARRAFVDLLGDAEEVEILRFAAQCLIPPTVAVHAEGDPQQRQFADRVRGWARSGSTLRILDYGSGRGRFAAALAGTTDIHA